jgi:lipopolysaccharide transport system ATP-binding protein
VDVFVCRAGILDKWESAASFEILPDLPYPEMVSAEATEQGAVLVDFSYVGQRG